MPDSFSIMTRFTLPFHEFFYIFKFVIAQFVNVFMFGVRMKLDLSPSYRLCFHRITVRLVRKSELLYSKGYSTDK